MAKLTIEQIALELADDNWKVLTKEYTNLDTEMEFQCSEGHSVFAPYKKIRTRRECPMCKQNKYKVMEKPTHSKKKGTKRILALDQATHITGYSVFDGKELVAYGTYTIKAEDEMDRIHEVNMWLLSQIENLQPDVVGIEGIQYQQEMGVTTFQTLARLQGVLIESCIIQGISYKICPTNTWRNFCGVKGRARADKKKSMQLKVKEEFDVSVSDDCADAIGIGKYVSSNFSKQTEIVSWE